MANVQKQFEAFNNLIKLDWRNEEATLREKRDTVLDALRRNLKKRFEEEGQHAPKFDTVLLGSYAMRTGVKPLDGDYDLDIGLLFHISKDDYGPVVVKKWVYDALEGHTSDVAIRRPCVTVRYSKGGRSLYHVDLAIYASACPDEKSYLAMGFPGSAEDRKVWFEADPEALVKVINSRHADDDRSQFRRVIRYLKRWKDYTFRSSGEAAPRGIAITAAAYQWFATSWTWTDLFAGKRAYNDLVAVHGLVTQMIAGFSYRYRETEQTWGDRLYVPLPVPPYSDPFDRMSNKQMLAFKSRLEGLRDGLHAAIMEVDPHVACMILRDHFGDDFPVPPKEETGKKGGPAIISSSSSA